MQSAITTRITSMTVRSIMAAKRELSDPLAGLRLSVDTPQSACCCRVSIRAATRELVEYEL